MELSVINKEGKETGKKVSLNDAIFGIQPSEHAIYLDVKLYLANQRQGTHKSKERGEVARTTKKVYKQKGTGNARHGSMKAPTFVGGGTVFGPRVRDYSFKVNKKVKALARKSALALKAQSNALTVLEDFQMEAIKTKQYAEIIKALGLENKKSLVVLNELDKNIYLSSRNFEGSNVVTASELNTYQIMKAQNLVVFEGALGKIEEVLS
jgi:large subunit ribosomal protein L4